MTWDELKEMIEKLPIEERKELAQVFDYNTKEFYELTPCFEGQPPFHLTINQKWLNLSCTKKHYESYLTR